MMLEFGIINFPAFILAGILLNLTPGSDTIFILARTLSLGRKAGLISALGISTGAMIHTLAAACGLSVVLASSATAFMVVKYAGACYLVYLGVRSLMAKDQMKITEKKSSQATGFRDIYVSGMLTNVLNPKVALFFLAFLPQFIATGHDQAMISFLILGATFITTGTFWCFCLALFSSMLASRISGEGRFGLYLQKITGLIFVGMGVKLAMTQR